MGFDDSLPIERYQNPKSKNAVLAMGNVFSATDCTYLSIYVELFTTIRTELDPIEHRLSVRTSIRVCHETSSLNIIIIIILITIKTTIIIIIILLIIIITIIIIIITLIVITIITIIIILIIIIRR